MDLPCSILQKDALTLQMHKQFAATQILKYKIQFSVCLKGEHQFHNKRML